MKLFRITTILLVLVFAATGCEKSLEELNENPNEPSAVSANVLLTSAQRSSMNSMVTESFLLGNNIAQLTAKTLRTEVGEYNWNAFPTVWQNQYLALADLVDAERIAMEEGNEKMQGVSLVMQSWIFSTLTLAYGDIPYSEAIGGIAGNEFTPAYDNQEDILMGEDGILDRLEEADDLLQGDGTIQGDIINDNSPMMWRRLANSLRLRMLMHLSTRMDEGDLSTQFQDVVNNSPIIAGNMHNSVLNYLGAFPNDYPLFPLKQGDFDAVVMSDRLVGRLDTLYEDPRLGVYARPDNILTIDTMPSAEPQFSGAANGDETGDDDDGEPCNKGGSRLGLRYYDYPGQPVGSERANGIIMTYAEVELILAEAANRGWLNGGDAEQHYRNGIQASMDYYNVDYANWGWSGFDDFYDNSGVSYNGDLSQIWEQQWVAIFFHGLEPFFHTRRWVFEASSDFTVGDVEFLRAPCANQNMDMLPIRFPYPGEEGTLNSANYDEAVSRLGGSNSQNAAMWLIDE